MRGEEEEESGGRERRKNLEGGEEKGKTQRRKLKSRCDDRRGWGGGGSQIPTSTPQLNKMTEVRILVGYSRNGVKKRRKKILAITRIPSNWSIFHKPVNTMCEGRCPET